MAAVVSPTPYALLQCELATPPARRVYFLLTCIWWAPWLLWPRDYNRRGTTLSRHNLYLASWNIYSRYALSQNPALGCEKPKSHGGAAQKCFGHTQLSSQLTAGTNYLPASECASWISCSVQSSDDCSSSQHLTSIVWRSPLSNAWLSPVNPQTAQDNKQVVVKPLILGWYANQEQTTRTGTKTQIYGCGFDRRKAEKRRRQARL